MGSERKHLENPNYPKCGKHTNVNFIGIICSYNTDKIIFFIQGKKHALSLIFALFFLFSDIPTSPL